MGNVLGEGKVGSILIHLIIFSGVVREGFSEEVTGSET